MRGEPPVCLNLHIGSLVRGTRTYPLRRKTVAVLHYLLDHAGQVVSGAELHSSVWQGVVVTNGVVRNCIRELRAALEEGSGTPRFIETLPRKGYRWIEPLPERLPSGSRKEDDTQKVKDRAPTPLVCRDEGAEGALPSSTLGLQATVPPMVGREAELAVLHKWLERARKAEHQLVFITGEPGIGKTTLVEAFVQTLAAPLWLARGQCVEQFGEGEAYLPLLTAFSRLGRTPGHEQFVSVLQQYAPTWLLQLPGLLSPTDLAQVQQRVQGSTRQRMLREIVDALEMLTRDHSLVLVIEDLHWSDVSTLEFLAALARRQAPMRLMVIGTYRPPDLPRAHPLFQG
jgi:DNA-binding winged helix-turn-helix (wHTH) protein